MSGNLDDIYSPNWVPYFSPAGNLHPDVTLSVECGICRTELAITKQADDDHEPFTMLPCGHVFGHQCVTEWFSRKPSCPVCRMNFRYRGCGHHVNLREIQGGSRFNINRDLPAAMTPGERLPDLCLNCRASPRTNNHQSRHRRQRPRTLDDEDTEEELIRSVLRISIEEYAPISRHNNRSGHGERPETQSIPQSGPFWDYRQPHDTAPINWWENFAYRSRRYDPYSLQNELAPAPARSIYYPDCSETRGEVRNLSSMLSPSHTTRSPSPIIYSPSHTTRSPSLTTYSPSHTTHSQSHTTPRQTHNSSPPFFLHPLARRRRLGRLIPMGQN